jgi:raffinose/stachyose/melibiose transport system permease protein
VSLAALVFLLPVYLVMVNAFKPAELIVRDPFGLPLNQLTLDNILRTTQSPTLSLWTAYATSAIIATLSVATLVVLGSMLGYVIGRASQRTSRRLYLYVIAGILVPPQIMLIPAVRVLVTLGLFHTMVGLILFNVATSLSYATLFTTAYVRSIPRELDESARIDGASSWTIFWRIIFPLLTPAVASIVIVSGVYFWNDFAAPQLILSADVYNVTTGIQRSVSKYVNDYGLLYGWLFVGSLPAILFIFFMQRYFIAGLTAGALKR